VLLSQLEVKTIEQEYVFSACSCDFSYRHALRLIFKWVVLIGGWQVPMWVSAVAIVISAYLAYEGFRINQSKQIR
jgi:hypothetical protein